MGRGDFKLLATVGVLSRQQQQAWRRATSSSHENLNSTQIVSAKWKKRVLSMETFSSVLGAALGLVAFEWWKLLFPSVVRILVANKTRADGWLLNKRKKEFQTFFHIDWIKNFVESEKKEKVSRYGKKEESSNWKASMSWKRRRKVGGNLNNASNALVSPCFLVGFQNVIFRSS